MLSPSTPVSTLPRVTATARPYHHGNLRPALLAAAERALADGRELSLRELAREIGVSHAAPRRHFPDKQALLDALAYDGFERLGHEMAAALEQAGHAFDDRLGAIARTYVRFATEHGALLDLMYAGKHRPGADELRQAADRAFTGPLALVAEGQAAGEVVAGDCEKLGLVAWAVFHGLASMANGGLLGDRPLEPLVDEAVARLLEGLRPR
jgi:AcrR family transcriptional regulator